MFKEPRNRLSDASLGQSRSLRSSVGIMTELRAGQPRNCSLILTRQEIFLLPKSSGSVPWPTQFVFNGYWGQSGRGVMLATHLHPVLGLRMTELYLYCPIELYGMQGDNLTSAVRLHTITSHPQLFACTPLPHTLSYSHAHHYLTPSVIRMHTITSHPYLFACTPLPHSLGSSHAHHYLTPQLFACTPLPHTLFIWDPF
jgi:hypothetical protein